MSVQAVVDFLAKAQEDAALQEQIKNTLKQGDVDANRSQLSQIAADSGFVFSVADYSQALEQIKKSGKSGELSDTDLEEVSGGASYSFSLSSSLFSTGGLLSKGGLLSSFSGLALY